MISRRAFVAEVVTVLIAPFPAEAQPGPKTARIGIIGSAPTPTPHKPYPAFLTRSSRGSASGGGSTARTSPSSFVRVAIPRLSRPSWSISRLT
jgi:hypothetical protein